MNIFKSMKLYQIRNEPGTCAISDYNQISDWPLKNFKVLKTSDVYSCSFEFDEEQHP